MIRTFGGVTGLTNQPQGLDIGIGASSQWVHDWSAYQPVYDLTGAATSVAANTWKTYVDITGKGFFKWCRASDASTNSPNPNIRLTIDGQAYGFDGVLAGDAQQGNEINFEIPFKTSLKIEVLNSHATLSASLIFEYLYLLQQSTPNPTKITLLQQSQRKMAYVNTTSQTLVDVLNVTGSGYLLDLKFVGYYVTAAGQIYGDITVDGTQKMTDRQLYSLNSAIIKQSDFIGPIRFSSSLRARIRTGLPGTTAICFARYSLD